MDVTIERLAAEKGYQFVKAKGSGENRLVTLQKGEREISVDNEALQDIASMAAAVENPDADGRIKAVS